MIHAPDVYEAGTHEHAVARFFDGWGRTDWAAMAAATTATWSSQHEDPAAALAAMFGRIALTRAEIVETRVVQGYDHQVLVDVLVMTEEIQGRDLEPGEIARVVRVLREAGPFRPARDGVWGVNPVSALRRVEPPRGDEEQRDEHGDDSGGSGGDATA